MTGNRHDAEDTRREILDLVGRYYRERHAPPPFDRDRDPVRYAGRVFGEAELQSLVDSSLDFYLTASRFTEAFEAGIEKQKLDGFPIRIYSAEKTLADSFKYRNKIGMETTLEAIRLYKERRRVNVEALLKFAEICRVQKVMRPYLEAIL